MAEVLLVDDDGSVLLTLAIALRRLGHSVTVAGDAFQAMAHLKRTHFDFLVSDVRMPGVSGLELAAQVRQMPEPPRIILTSAYPSIEDRDKVSEAFLQKPLDVQRLSEYLNSAATSHPAISGRARQPFARASGYDVPSVVSSPPRTRN
jgi:CheY-like chemotaxis protein